MDLLIVQPSGSKTEVGVPDTVASGRIANRLAELWQLPTVGSEGGTLAYVLQDELSGRHIGPGETLAQAGVQEHDVLRLLAARDPVPIPTAFEGGSSAARARSARLALAAIAMAALLTAGAGALLVTGVLSGVPHRSGKSTRLPAAAATGASEASPTSMARGQSEQSSDRSAIISLLGEYQRGYTEHDLSTLSRLFAPQVSRRGLAAGGCKVSHGRSAVLADYRSQFDLGSGSYTLIGLSEGQITFHGQTQAHLDARYRITPGGSGFVDFGLTKLDGRWAIEEVYAACH